ncbi:MAG: porin [Pseudomonadota bacterium]
MKSTLLTTTAMIVAFAGAASADGHAGLALSGSAGLGYNDDVEDGFFWDTDVQVTGTAALDNGVTASASVEIEVASDTIADDAIDSEDLVLSLSTDAASLTYGDVDPVAEDRFGGVDGDSTAGFNDQDAHFDVVGFDAMLVGEVTVAGITAALSYGVFANEPNAGDVGPAPTSVPLDDVDVIDALQVYATGDFGQFGFEFAYQDEIVGVTDYTVIGVAGSASFAGADVTVSYLDDETENSIGIGVAYPVGPVTLSGYYSVNDVAEDSYGVEADYADGPIAVNAFYDFEGGATDADADDFSEFGVEGSYDVGNGLTVLAGYISTDDAGTETAATYAAGTYDLGGGAELLVSYAEDEANATNDEIGDPEYNHGTTVAVTFSF